LFPCQEQEKRKMREFHLSNDDLAMIVDALRIIEPGDFDGAARAQELADSMQEIWRRRQLPQAVTVVCRERNGTTEPILYSGAILGEITKEKVTTMVRAFREEELGPDEGAIDWVSRLEPMVVLEGDVRQLADYRSGL
jgi:hypothetical protein